MYYSFYNSGTVYFFKPGKPAYDIRDGVKRSALEFHTMLVNEANRVDVFILDDHGNMVVKSAKNPSHVPMAEWKKLKEENKRKNRYK
jgi:fructose-1-phosphate kinase PfkB-like protein